MANYGGQSDFHKEDLITLLQNSDEEHGYVVWTTIDGRALINLYKSERPRGTSVAEASLPTYSCSLIAYRLGDRHASPMNPTGHAQLTTLLRRLTYHPNIAQVHFEGIFDIPDCFHGFIPEISVYRTSDPSNGSSESGAAGRAPSSRAQARLAILKEPIRCTVLQRMTELDNKSNLLSRLGRMLLARDIAEIMQLLLQHDIDADALTMDNLAWSTEGCDEGDGGRVVLLPVFATSRNIFVSGAEGECSDGPAAASAGGSSGSSSRDKDKPAQERRHGMAASKLLRSKFFGGCVQLLLYLASLPGPGAPASSATGTDALSALSVEAAHSPALAAFQSALADATSGIEVLDALQLYLLHLPRRFPTSGDPAIDQDARRLLPLLCGPCPESSAIDAARKAFEEIHRTSSSLSVVQMMWCIIRGLGILDMHQDATGLLGLLQEQSVIVAGQLNVSNKAVKNQIIAILKGTGPPVPPCVGAFAVYLCGSKTSVCPQELLIDAGVVPILVDLLQTDSSSTRQATAQALGWLAKGPTLSIVQSSSIPILVRMLSSMDEAEALHAAVALRAIACCGEEARNTIVEAGAVQSIVCLLTCVSSRLLIAAAEILSGLGRGEAEHRLDRLLESGCLEHLVQAVKHSDIPVAKAASGAIECFAKGNDLVRRGLRDAEAVESLMHRVSLSIDASSCAAADALATFAGQSTSMAERIASKTALSALARMLDSTDLEARYSASQCLASISACSWTAQVAIVDAGALPMLSILCTRCVMDKRDRSVLVAALRTITNVAHCDKNPHDLAKTGIIAVIVAILQGDDSELAMHAAGLVSGLATGYRSAKIFGSILCDACVIPHLVRLLGSGGAPVQVEEYVAAALCSLTFCDRKLHKYMIGYGILGILPVMHSSSITARWSVVGIIQSLQEGPIDIIDAVLEAGAIQAMVQMLSIDSQVGSCDSVFECLENLAAEGRDDLKQSIVEAGTLPFIVAALAPDISKDLDWDHTSGLPPLCAAHFLGLLCDQSPPRTTAAMNAGALAKLLRLVDSAKSDSDLETASTAASCLDYMVQALPLPITSVLTATDLVSKLYAWFQESDDCDDEHLPLLELTHRLMCASDGAKLAFADAYGLYNCAELLGHEVDDIANIAARCISVYTTSKPEPMHAAADALRRAIPSLLLALDPPSEATASHVHAALLNLANSGADTRRMLQQLGVLSAMVKLLDSDDEVNINAAARFLAAFARAASSSVEAIDHAKALPGLVRMLEPDSLGCRIIAAQALTHVASRPSSAQLLVARSDALRSLKAMVKSDEEPCYIASMQCIEQLSCAGTDVLQELLASQLIQSIASMMDSESDQKSRIATQTVFNVSRAKDAQLTENLVEYGVILKLKRSMLGKQDCVAVNAGFALGYILRTSAETGKDALQAGITMPIVQMLRSGEYERSEAAIYAAYWLLRTCKNQAHLFAKEGMIPALVHHIGFKPEVMTRTMLCTKPHCQAMIASTIRRLAFGNAQRKQAVVDARGIPGLAEQLQSPSRDRARAAAAAFHTLASCPGSQWRAIANSTALKGLAVLIARDDCSAEGCLAAGAILTNADEVHRAFVNTKVLARLFEAAVAGPNLTYTKAQRVLNRVFAYEVAHGDALLRIGATYLLQTVYSEKCIAQGTQLMLRVLQIFSARANASIHREVTAAALLLLTSPNKPVASGVEVMLGEEASRCSACRLAVVAAGALPAIIGKLSAQAELTTSSGALYAVVSLATDSQEHAQAVADAGAVPVLYQILKKGYPPAKVGATRALLSIIEINATERARVADAGVLPILVASLDDGNSELVGQTLLALCALMQNPREGYAAHISESNAIPRLLQLLQTDIRSHLDSAAQALQLLASSSTRARQYCAKKGALESICACLRVSSDARWHERAETDARIELLACLRHVAQHSQDGIEALLRVPATSAIRVCLESTNDDVLLAAVDCLTAMLCGRVDRRDRIVEAIISNGLLLPLVSILRTRMPALAETDSEVCDVLDLLYVVSDDEDDSFIEESSLMQAKGLCIATLQLLVQSSYASSGALVKAGAVQAMIDLMSSNEQSPDDDQETATALCFVARDSYSAQALVLESKVALPRIMRLLERGRDEQVRAALSVLCSMSRAGEKSYKVLFEHKVIPAMLRLLNPGWAAGTSSIAIEVLANLASGTEDLQVALVQSGTLSIVTRVLQQQEHGSSNAVIRLLARLSLGSLQVKRAMGSSAVLECLTPLLACEATAAAEPQRVVLGILTAIAEAGTDMQKAIVSAGALQSLATALSADDNGVVNGALNALIALSSGPREVKHSIIDCADCIAQIKLLLAAKSAVIAKQAAACLGRLSSGGDDVRQSLAKAGTIPAMLLLLQSYDPVIVVITVEFLETMACGAMPVKRAMLEAGAVPELVRLLGRSSGSTWDTAAATLAWLAGGSPEIAAAVLQAGTMPAIASKLLSPGPAPQASAAISALSKFVSGPCAVKQAIASTDGVLARLVQVYMGERTPVKARKAVETILRCVARGSAGLQTAVTKAGTSQGISDLLVRLGIVPVRSAWGAAGGGSG